MPYDLDPRRTALLLIDAQNEYFLTDGALHTPNAAAIEPNLRRLLAAARAAGAHVVHVHHVHAPEGYDVGRMGDFGGEPSFVAGTEGARPFATLAPLAGEPVVEKTRYSAFVNTALESILKTWGADTVVVTGLMTQFCSVTTARHAHDLDYRVVFVPDANAGPDLPDVGFGETPHATSLAAIASALRIGVADVADTDEVVARLRAA